MRIVGIGACASVIASWLSMTALAQEPLPKRIIINPAGKQAQQAVVIPQPRLPFGSKFAMIQNKSIQDDLKLADDQAAKVKELVAKYNQAIKEPLKDQVEQFKRLQQLNQANEKVAEELLKPEQVRRLQQINLQQQGEYIFSSPQVATSLKLSDEQKQLIRDIQLDSSRIQQAIYQQAGTDFREAQKQTAELRRVVVEIITAILTEEQKKSWKDLVGEPFRGDWYYGRGGFGGVQLQPVVPKNGQAVIIRIPDR